MGTRGKSNGIYQQNKSQGWKWWSQRWTMEMSEETFGTKINKIQQKNSPILAIMLHVIKLIHKMGPLQSVFTQTSTLIH